VTRPLVAGVVHTGGDVLLGLHAVAWAAGAPCVRLPLSSVERGYELNPYAPVVKINLYSDGGRRHAPTPTKPNSTGRKTDTSICSATPTGPKPNSSPDSATANSASPNSLDKTTDHLDSGCAVLATALDLLDRPRDLYNTATDHARKLLNKAIFTRLYLDTDSPETAPPSPPTTSTSPSPASYTPREPRTNPTNTKRSTTTSARLDSQQCQRPPAYRRCPRTSPTR
jgi:hypothetical protein